MKKSLLLLIAINIFYCCQNTSENDSKDSTINQVESSLIQPVFVEGDSLWSIEERMEHYGVPGVSITVIKDYQIAWSKSYGFMDKDSKAPVTNQTLFQAGSISKPVAAYGALKLVEQGKLDLDKDINSYLKSWTLPDSEFTAENKVALKHLLSHTGGLTVHGFLGYSPDLPVPTLVQVLNGEKPANSPPIFVDKAPDESYRYSGGGFSVMQQAMIDVEGKTFPEIMDEQILQPLEMTNSTYNQPLQEQRLKMAATGYLPDGSMTKGKRHTYPEMAAAGLWTTSEDLAKFAVDIQNTYKGENAKVMSKEMVTTMLTPYYKDFIGMGIFINTYKDEKYFGHGGWDEGFSSEMVAHRDKGYGVVVLTNSNHPDFIRELIRSVAMSYQWDEYVPMYKALAANDDELEKFNGRYKLNNSEVITISNKDNRLFGSGLIEEPEELFKITDSTFLRREGHKHVQFKTDADGKTTLNILDINTGEVQRTLATMAAGEKLPFEYLQSGYFDKAIEGYKQLMMDNPNDSAVNEGNLNVIGYNLLGDGKMELAKDLFKVNMLLYPESSNVYDSYAEACMKLGENELAIENYKKSLVLDPNNSNAETMIAEIIKNRE